MQKTQLPINKYLRNLMPTAYMFLKKGFIEVWTMKYVYGLFDPNISKYGPGSYWKIISIRQSLNIQKKLMEEKK